MSKYEEEENSHFGCLLLVLFFAGLYVILFDPFHIFPEVTMPFYETTKENTAAPAKKEEPLPSVAPTAGKGVVVYVTGAVKKPGVYEMQPGTYVYDAVAAAGDVLPYADMSGVNLAEPVTKSMKIYIPLDVKHRDIGAENLININTADEKELEKLPGVGRVTALKILTYREENGLFQKKEDLKKVPSIGDAKYSRIEDKITL